MTEPSAFLKLSSIGKQFGGLSALSDVSLHIRQIEAVAALGKPVWSEKPLALTRREAERAVAEKTDGDLIALAHLDRQRRASGDAGATTDNRIGAQVAGILIGDMHRAATAFAIAIFFAKKFGKHIFYFGPLADAVPVAAMR